MYAKLLRQVRDSLTPENWTRHGYFKLEDNICKMCVHGAAQLIVNPQVAKALSNNDIALARMYADGGYTLIRPIENDSDARQAWRMRKTKKDIVINDVSHGNHNLQYLMTMFGINWSFNDRADTTLDMIKAALTQAANWAEENEEFLLTN